MHGDEVHLIHMRPLDTLLPGHRKPLVRGDSDSVRNRVHLEASFLALIPDSPLEPYTTWAVHINSVITVRDRPYVRRCCIAAINTGATHGPREPRPQDSLRWSVIRRPWAAVKLRPPPMPKWRGRPQQGELRPRTASPRALRRRVG